MNASDIYAGLLSRGLPEHVAQGFMDNFAAESGLNPGINERNPTVPGNRGGRGLYQLTGPRRDAYEAQYGTDYGGDSQLDFLMQELRGPERAAAQAIMGAGNRADATRAISQKFLRPGHDNSAARVGMWNGGNQMPVEQFIDNFDALLGGGGDNTLVGGQGGDPLRMLQQPELSMRHQVAGTMSNIGDILSNYGRGTQLPSVLSGDRQMATQRAKQGRNQTAQWLHQNGDTELANMVLTGGMTGAQAMAYKQQAKLAEQRLALTGTSVGAQKILADGTIIQSTNAGPIVFGPAGNQLQGEEAANAIRNAQAYGVEVATSRAGGQEAGKLESRADLGAAAAGATAAGTAAIGQGVKAFEGAKKIETSINNINTAISAIDNGADAGAIAKNLPDVTVASATLRNAMDMMGLDVIGATTFGALSQGELDLAMSVAVPRNLGENELREWLVKKGEAQQKAHDALMDAAQFLSKPGQTIDQWIARNQQGGGATASGAPVLVYNPVTGGFDPK